MAEDLYIFEITDNDNGCPNSDEPNYMLYSIKKGFMTPLSDDFNRGFPTFFSKHQVISHIQGRQIKELITYDPNNPSTLRSSPYELDDSDVIEACASDGEWYQYSHSGLHPGDFKDEGVDLTVLRQPQINELESSLSSYEAA